MNGVVIPIKVSDKVLEKIKKSDFVDLKIETDNVGINKRFFSKECIIKVKKGGKL